MYGSFQIIFHGKKVYSPVVTSTYWGLTVLDIVRDRKFKIQALHSTGVQFNCEAEKAEKEICVYIHTLSCTHTHPASHALTLTYSLSHTHPSTPKTRRRTHSELEVGFRKGLQQGWGGWVGGGIYFHNQSMRKKYLYFQSICFVLIFR